MYFWFFPGARRPAAPLLRRLLPSLLDFSILFGRLRLLLGRPSSPPPLRIVSGHRPLPLRHLRRSPPRPGPSPRSHRSRFPRLLRLRRSRLLRRLRPILQRTRPPRLVVTLPAVVVPPVVIIPTTPVAPSPVSRVASSRRSAPPLLVSRFCLGGRGGPLTLRRHSLLMFRRRWRKRRRTLSLPLRRRRLVPRLLFVLALVLFAFLLFRFLWFRRTAKQKQ